jgi:hypothetical protein
MLLGRRLVYIKLQVLLMFSKPTVLVKLTKNPLTGRILSQQAVVYIQRTANG